MIKPDPSCIFCKIAAQQVPAAVVYEDETLLAFLDVGPLAEGHLLLIPRTHHVHLADMPEDLCGRLGALVPRLGRVLLRVTKADGFNLLCNHGAAAGQVVGHVHFHLIPRMNDDGLGYRWNAGVYQPGRADELAEAYRTALASDVR